MQYFLELRYGMLSNPLNVAYNTGASASYNPPLPRPRGPRWKRRRRVRKYCHWGLHVVHGIGNSSEQLEQVISGAFFLFFLQSHELSRAKPISLTEDSMLVSMIGGRYSSTGDVCLLCGAERSSSSALFAKTPRDRR